MSHGAEHQIEQAEHAAHASHDGFNRNVTMSIAMVAAVLACVTMLGHRAHNETLRLQGEALALQGEALGLQTKAGIMSTKAANAWAYYQSKNMFNLEAEIAVDLLSVLTTRPDKKEEFDKIYKGYKASIAKYSGDENHRTRSPADDKKKSEGKLAKALDEAKKLEDDTKDLQEKAEKKIEETHKRMAESHEEHGKAARMDFGELGLQFAVVLCSLAILTRNRSFWFGGIASAVIGAAISASGLLGMFMGEHH